MGSVRNIGTKEKPLWYMRYIEIDGQRKEAPTHQPSKALAEACLRETESRVARGVLGVPERPTEEQIKLKTITFDGLAARFLVEYQRRKIKNLRAYRIHAQGAFRRMSPLIGYEQAAQITSERIEEARDALLAKKYTPATVAGTIAYVSKMFSWAVEKKIMSESPMRGVEYPDHEPSEDHFAIDEVHRLLHPAMRRPMVAFALLTGARKGEIYGLQWSSIDFMRKRIEIKRSYTTTPKSGKPRTIPLHRDLAPILLAWRAICPSTPEGLVFPVTGLLSTADGRTVPGWRMGTQNNMANLVEFLELLGCHVPEKPWHAMRHTFISQLAEAGASPIAIERIVGHAPSGNKITAGYTHLSLDFLARELDKLDIMPPSEMPPPTLHAVALPEHLPPPAEGELLSTAQAAKRLGITPGGLVHRVRKDPSLRKYIVRIPQKNAHGEIWRWHWPLPTPVGRQVGGRRRPGLSDGAGTCVELRPLLTPPPFDADLLSYQQAADVVGVTYDAFKVLVRKHPDLSQLFTGEGRGNRRIDRADLLRWAESGVWKPSRIGPDKQLPPPYPDPLMLQSADVLDPQATDPTLSEPGDLLSYSDAAVFCGITYGAFRVRVHGEPALARLAIGKGRRTRFSKAALETYMGNRPRKRR